MTTLQRHDEAGAIPPFVRDLLDPAAYPHPAGDIRLYETHISWVVLAGNYAYKLKKPVDMQFLDFSTAAKRRAACEDEVRLNRRLCPDLYLGVSEIVERGGRYVVGGRGRIGEPAVRMRRMPAEGMLPRLLAEGAVDARLVRRIARKLARFHAQAATGPGVDEYGTPAAVRANWRENFEQTAPFVGSVVDTDVHQRIVAFVERFLVEQHDLLEQRVAAGRIRECHGDLHARNICVAGRRLWLFDCIEFNPRLRCSDVAAEVAFLAMDLDHYGRADLAAAFVQHYRRESGDMEIPHLLDFYRCYRAYVRGKVLCLRRASTDVSDEEAAADRAEARAYFDLAWAYAGGLAQPGARRAPLLVLSMGLPASGKTSLARTLAGRLGLLHLSSDVVRKELAGLRPTDRAGGAFGEGLYDPAMTRRTYAALRRRAARWLRSGHSVVLDATFGSVAERAAVRRLAERSRARLVILVCTTDEATTLARLRAREGDPTVESDARLAQWPALRAAFVPPDELPEAVTIDTTASIGDAADQALAALMGIGGTMNDER
jgi:aminoglycoside phosphotransferase family enzyme/predicted kinase